MDGIESTIASPMILPPLRSLRAGPDSQCERIGEAPIQALRGDVRLLTFLMSEFDAEIESELLDNYQNL